MKKLIAGLILTMGVLVFAHATQAADISTPLSGEQSGQGEVIEPISMDVYIPKNLEESEDWVPVKQHNGMTYYIYANDFRIRSHSMKSRKWRARVIGESEDGKTVISIKAKSNCRGRYIVVLEEIVNGEIVKGSSKKRSIKPNTVESLLNNIICKKVYYGD